MNQFRRTSLERAVEEATYKYKLEGKIFVAPVTRSILIKGFKRDYTKDFQPYTPTRDIMAWISKCMKSERDLEKINDEAYLNVIQDKLL